MYKPKYFNTDILMKSVFSWLAQDFRSELGFDFSSDLSNALDCGIANFRSLEKGSFMLSPYRYFKCRYQMERLFKRYRFADEAKTEEQLEREANEKFKATQFRLGFKRPTTYRASLVIQEARNIIKKILRDYDEVEHISACKFGSKSDVGNTARDAYLDVKLSTPLSGSKEHIAWFKTHALEDPILRDLLCKCSPSGQPVYAECDVLTLTNVPKTSESYRSIMPNTRIGVFYTYGLGRMIQARLKDEGLDITKLQQWHGILAKNYSISRSHVTADLSAASDSFTYELVARLLPRKWLLAVNRGRNRNLKIGDETIQLQSFMTMGIGYTFQLQTLLFYALLKSIQGLSKTKGRISVYGDDLIYPTRMHHFVRTIFTDVGFILNDDKTFVKQSFRESCGSDFYCGIDVRPFQPEGGFQLLAPARYVVLVYKTINGLLRRWDREEIPQTIRYLFGEILRVDSVILQVPPSFPDYSGVKVRDVQMTWHEPWSRVCYNHNWSPEFVFYRLQDRDRVVPQQYGYYWDSLRGMTKDVVPPLDEFGRELKVVWETLLGKSETQTHLGDLRSFHFTAPSSLKWRKCPHQPKNYRSITGKRLRKLQAVVAVKMGRNTPIRQKSSVPIWT